MVCAEWASADNAAVVRWGYGTTSPAGPSSTSRRSRISRRQDPVPVLPSSEIAYHKFGRETQLLFSETLDMTDYGSWYWATNNVANLTHQSGQDTDVRGAFTSTGRLTNGNDTRFRAISDALPAYGFAVDLGPVTSTPVSVLFTIGLAQQQAVQFNGGNGTEPINSLWTSYYATEIDAVSNLISLASTGHWSSVLMMCQYPDLP